MLDQYRFHGNTQIKMIPSFYKQAKELKNMSRYIFAKKNIKKYENFIFKPPTVKFFVVVYT